MVWDGCTAAQSLGLERLQRECMRIITGLPLFCRLDHLYVESGFYDLTERRRERRLTLMYKSVFLRQCPDYFRDLIPCLRALALLSGKTLGQ